MWNRWLACCLESGRSAVQSLDVRGKDYDFCDTIMATLTPATDALFADIGSEHGESLFEFLEDVQFWIKDRGGRYVRANRALFTNYGFSDAAAIIGKTDHELFPPHLATQYEQDDREVLAGRPVRDRIELVARPDHSTGWHVTNKIPLRSRTGQVIATAGITRDLTLHSTSGAAFNTLQPVIEHIRTHLDQPLQKPRLARLLGLSIRSLERRFVAASGLSLLTYQRTLRMHRACQQLVSTQMPITTIALGIGYGDHSHFTREFGKRFGVSPRIYRQRWYRGEDLA